MSRAVLRFGTVTVNPALIRGVVAIYAKTPAATARATGPHNASVENRLKRKKKLPPKKPFELISHSPTPRR